MHKSFFMNHVRAIVVYSLQYLILLKIRTSIDIFDTEKCKVTFGLKYIHVQKWRQTRTFHEMGYNKSSLQAFGSRAKFHQSIWDTDLQKSSDFLLNPICM